MLSCLKAHRQTGGTHARPSLVGLHKMQPTRQSTTAKDHAFACHPGHDALTLLFVLFSMRSTQLHIAPVDLMSILQSTVCLFYLRLHWPHISAASVYLPGTNLICIADGFSQPGHHAYGSTGCVAPSIVVRAAVVSISASGITLDAILCQGTLQEAGTSASLTARIFHCYLACDFGVAALTLMTGLPAAELSAQVSHARGS